MSIIPVGLQFVLFDFDQDVPTIRLVKKLGLYHAIEQDPGQRETIVTVALHCRDECLLLINPVPAI